MYESFYGLSASPFQLNPDPSFFFGSRGHSSAYSYLKFGVFQAEGFIVITGEIGAGKTTLVRTLLAELDAQDVVAAQLVSTQLDGAEVLRAVAAAFGLPVKAVTKAELIATIEAFLTMLVTRRQRALLIVDEAQNLSPDAIEELRMLSNFQIGSKPLLQSFLIGQPELRDILRAPSMEQLRQRVLASYHLGPMDEHETGAYVEHRLRKVGWAGDPAIDPAVYPIIYAWARGLPRKINLLCNRVLLASFLGGKHEIAPADVLAVIEELRGEIGGAAANFIAPPIPAASTPAPPAPTAPVVPAPIVPAMPEASAPAAGAVPASVAASVTATVPKPLAVHEEASAAPKPPGPAQPRNRRALPKPVGDDGPIICAIGIRPEIIKAASIVRAIDAHTDLPNAMLVHTGQHYDFALSEQLFADLDLHAPDYNLEVGSASPAVQLADIMRRFEEIVDELRPSMIFTIGASQSTLGCALVAAQRRVPMAHAEAGLRSFDRAEPEELNRRVVDQLADVLYTTEHDAASNLAREGIGADRVHFVGSLSADALLRARGHAVEPAEVLRCAGIEPAPFVTAERFVVATLHRASTVDSREQLAQALRMMVAVSAEAPVVWLTHPHTRTRMEQFGLAGIVTQGRIAILPPQGYLETVGLLSRSLAVMTDSGSIQEECSMLGVPCWVMRATTDRPATVELGSCELVGLDTALVLRRLAEVRSGQVRSVRIPDYWDGRSAERISAHLCRWYAAQRRKC